MASQNIDELLNETLKRLSSRRRAPLSTYRLQFHKGFTFADATAITAYLAELGISHAYASPYLKARAGSTHGYDIIDHHQLNPEVGSEADFDAWVAELRRRHMGHILDIVPNHVGIATNDNAWWNDVLANGRTSQYAHYFDIAWRGSPRPEDYDKVLLPTLGSAYGDVLEKGELRLVKDPAPAVAYYDRRFPISPQSWADVANDGVALNGAPGDAASFDRLDQLLSKQHYRLAYWRVASDEINYRRFFDVNDLAALCMECLDVFEDTHQLILRLLAEGKLDGVRVDHPDGLFDPHTYFKRLQRHYIAEVAMRTAGDRTPETKAGLLQRLEEQDDPDPQPLYIVAEKILAPGEPLPPQWAVDGTSGYDFLNVINGLFVDRAHAAVFTQRYNECVKSDNSFPQIAYEKKRLILEISLASELRMLAHQLDKLAQADLHSRDFTLAGLHDALREIIACFPVYRSYIADDAVREADRNYIDDAIREAAERNPKMSRAVFEFIRDTLLLHYGGEHLRDQQRQFAGKFQQVTAPVTAKGIEDTAFYVYNCLVSLNEVGGSPEHFGNSPDVVHQYLAERQAMWPHAMSCLSTHDTKRSEDVRARINVLSEMPEQWWSAVARWSRQNEPHRRHVQDLIVPDANEELLLYQTLIGAWPMEPGEGGILETFVKRICGYMQKALREAKVHTSWINPNPQYEQALGDFVRDILSEQTSASFLQDFRAFQRRVSHFGIFNSLSQTLLKLIAPGVPDTYQGTEIWDPSLVDPDNRRPVDYPLRQKILAEIKAGFEAAADNRAPFLRDLLLQKEDGRCKLLTIWRALWCRREHPALFSDGQYVPIEASGPAAENIFAFCRSQGDEHAMAIVPRLLTRVVGSIGELPVGQGVWRQTSLIVPMLDPDKPLVNCLTGQPVSVQKEKGCSFIAVSDALADFPVALLISQT